MYSNEKKGFSLLDLIVKIIFAALFIFILVWLFQKKVPNMAPFYSNVFRENIAYMQSAGESYFTDDKMPKEIGQEEKITLDSMIQRKLIIPFVDEDGNACNVYESYVSMTKTDLGYELKTNLVCPKESDYTIKILGCHTYCKDAACSKKCRVEQITQYQFKKKVTSTTTKYSCPSGYTLDGKKCTKKVLVDTKSAEHTTTTPHEIVEPATLVVVGSKCVSADRITNKSYTEKLTNKEYTTKVTNKEYTDKVSGKEYTEKLTNKSYTDKITTTTPATTKKEPYTCQKTKTERRCTTTYQSYSYSCNCSGSWYHGQYVTSCSTCSGSTPVESCSDVSVPYNDTCYKDVTVPGSTTYSCPSGYTKEGSGSSLKCYKNTYSCPSGYTKEGSGSSLKCYKTTYSCPSGYTKEGSGSSLKCYKNTYSCPSGYTNEGSGSSLKCYKNTYSCPSGYTKEGSGSSLKCYKNTYSCPSGYAFDPSKSQTLCYKCTDGSQYYTCPDKTYTLDGNKCKKTITDTTTDLRCDSGYVLEGNKCNKYSTDTKDATGKKETKTSWKYKWSEKTSLSGWTKTGKTKTVKGKEICE